MALFRSTHHILNAFLGTPALCQQRRHLQPSNLCIACSFCCLHSGSTSSVCRVAGWGRSMRQIDKTAGRLTAFLLHCHLYAFAFHKCKAELFPCKFCGLTSCRNHSQLQKCYKRGCTFQPTPLSLHITGAHHFCILPPKKRVVVCFVIICSVPFSPTKAEAYHLLCR